MNSARKPAFAARKAQQGVALLMTMVFLIALSFFAIAAYNNANTNIRVVGNMQVRAEMQSAAQRAIELTLKNGAYESTPEVVAASPVDVDVDGDGVTDYLVLVAPTCYRVALVSGCGGATLSSGGASGTLIDDGTASAASGETCFLKEWNFRAVVSDNRSGASYIVNEGFANVSDNGNCG